MIVTKYDVLFDPICDSHEWIIKSNNLNDKILTPDFVRVEISPADNGNNGYNGDNGDSCDYSLPFSEWKYKVDQKVLPDWYNAKWAEEQCRAALPMWAKTRFVTEGDHTCEHGQILIVLSGSPTIKQSSGKICVYGLSSPVINKLHGVVYTYGLSEPNIMQSSGSIYTYGSSAPKIKQLGGYVYTCNSSVPVIEQLGGVIRACDSSAPKIEQKDGEIYAYGLSIPQIKRSGGKSYKHGEYAPVVTEVYCFKKNCHSYWTE
jgi:hypothetical protein